MESNRVIRLDQGYNCHSSWKAPRWGVYFIIRRFTNCANQTCTCSNSFLKDYTLINAFLFAFKQIFKRWTHKGLDHSIMHWCSTCIWRCASVHAVDSRGRASIRRNFSCHVRAVTQGSSRWMSNPRLTLPLWMWKRHDPSPKDPYLSPLSTPFSFCSWCRDVRASGNWFLS